MTSAGAAVVAWGAVSARGEGNDAASAGTIGLAATSVITRDPELAAAGLARPFAARARVDATRDAGEAGIEAAAEDRATRLLLRALDGCMRALDAEVPGWRRLRVGLAMEWRSAGSRRLSLPAKGL